MQKKILVTILSLVLLSNVSIVSNAVEEPTSTIGTSNTESITGDVNGDGIVNVLDTLALKNHILEGKTIENYIYDINGDDIVNKVDLIQNKRASFELDTFSYYNDGIYDEYIPFDYSKLNYEIYENQVWVTIKHQYSNFDKVWTIEDFKVDNIAYIDDLTNLKIDDFKNTDNFNKVIVLYLKDTGKKNIIKIIHELESMVEINKINVIKKEYPVDDSI